MTAAFPALSRWSWIVVGSACTMGCSVDDRRLQPIVPIPDAVASNCGIIPDCDSTDDDASSTGDPGQSCTGLCPDLNHNNLLDSTESLIANSQFNEDIEGWSPDTGIGLGWNGSDACGKCDSGAISVTNEYAGTSGDISSAHSVSVQIAVAASVPPQVGFASVFFDNVLLTAP